jgi:hypothetical protein
MPRLQRRDKRCASQHKPHDLLHDDSTRPRQHRVSKVPVCPEDTATRADLTSMVFGSVREARSLIGYELTVAIGGTRPESPALLAAPERRNLAVPLTGLGSAHGSRAEGQY